MAKPLNVLIVSSDAQARERYKAFLHDDDERPYVVWDVESGKGALLHFREQTPDCMLLDYTLPDMSGLDVLAGLGCDRDDTKLGVVMIVGGADETAALRALKLGAHDYLTTGYVTKGALSRAIGNVITKVSMRRTMKTQETKLLDMERQRVVLDSALGLAREFRQALTVLKGNLELLSDPGLDATDHTAFLGDCRRAAERLDTLARKFVELEN